jgi:hypothetical protein
MRSVKASEAQDKSCGTNWYKKNYTNKQTKIQPLNFEALLELP